MKWKTENERDGFTIYARCTGTKKDNFGHNVMYFQCNRSGELRKRGKGVKRLKSQGKFRFNKLIQLKKDLKA